MQCCLKAWRSQPSGFRPCPLLTGIFLDSFLNLLMIYTVDDEMKNFIAIWGWGTLFLTCALFAHTVFHTVEETVPAFMGCSFYTQSYYWLVANWPNLLQNAPPGVYLALHNFFSRLLPLYFFKRVSGIKFEMSIYFLIKFLSFNIWYAVFAPFSINFNFNSPVFLICTKSHSNIFGNGLSFWVKPCYLPLFSLGFRASRTF